MRLSTSDETRERQRQRQRNDMHVEDTLLRSIFCMASCQTRQMSTVLGYVEGRSSTLMERKISSSWYASIKIVEFKQKEKISMFNVPFIATLTISQLFSQNFSYAKSKSCIISKIYGNKHIIGIQEYKKKLLDELWAI